MLVDHHVFLHHIPGRGGQYAGPAVFLRLLQRDVQKRLEVVVVVLLHGHGVEPVGVQRLAVQRQRAERLRASGPDDVHPVGELVELRMLALKRLIPQDVAQHPLQLSAGDLEHIHRVVVGQALRKVGVVYHGTQRVAADSAGAHEHQVDAEAVPQDVGDQVAQRRLLIALGMTQLAGEPRDDAVVFLGGSAFVALDERFHLLVAGAVGVVNGDHLPCEGVDGVEVGVHHDIETADLVGAGARLHDIDVVDLEGLLQPRVAVAADDQIHAPCGIQHCRQSLVLLKADVGEQHGEVDVDGVVGVADVAHLPGRLADVHKGADQLVALGGGQHLLGDDADEQDLHAVDMGDPEGLEHPPPVGFDVQIGVDDGEIRALLQKQKMGQTVVDLVVADGGHVRPHQIHDADGGGTLVLRIDDAAAEHIARHGVDHIFLLPPHLVDIAGEQRYAAHQPLVDLLGQKIAVHIV